MNRVLCGLALLALVACVGDGTGLDENGNPIGTGPVCGTPGNPPCGPFDPIQAIFTANCALSGCHAGVQPQQGQNLSEGQAYANIVDVPANEQPNLMRVRPFLPDSSYLVHKIQGTHVGVGGSGGQMPLGRIPLTQAQIDLIRDWITAGAPNN